MLAYLCEVKSTLRTQDQSVEDLKDEIKRLSTEKVELERKLDYERGTAVAVETNLREHCARAHQAYGTLIE